MDTTTDWSALARVLLDGMGDFVAGAGRPAWVLVTGGPAGPDGELALEVSDEPGGLLGWVAPPRYQAAAVVATGRVRIARPADYPSGRSGNAVVDGEGVRLACLVARHGATGWAMDLPGGSAAADPPEGGRMLDCLKRCFGLPTPPAPADPGRLHLVAWLGAVLDAVQAGTGASWCDLLALHPMTAGLSRPELHGVGPEVLPDLVRVAGRAWSWEELRRRAHDGRWAGSPVPAGLAGWMDEGMFARWVLDDLPAPEEFIECIRPHVTPATARRLAHAVRTAA